MSQETRELTAEGAQRIIGALALITEAGQPYKGIEVTNVAYTKGDGTPFTYPSGEAYAVVNLKATNQYGLAQAVEDFSNEDWQEACNHNMSIAMSIEEADKIGKGITGTLICHMVPLKDENGELTGEEALLPRRFTPAKAIEAGKIDFKALLAKKKEGVPNNA